MVLVPSRPESGFPEATTRELKTELEHSKSQRSHKEQQVKLVQWDFLLYFSIPLK